MKEAILKEKQRSREHPGDPLFKNNLKTLNSHDMIFIFFFFFIFLLGATYTDLGNMEMVLIS